MLVKEMIEQLSKLPQDAECYVYSAEPGTFDKATITVDTRFSYDEKNDFTFICSREGDEAHRGVLIY